jgi:D-alanyl-D-alanine carboxypeptidase/D-alanyl-D-alanine-endopeptidase (penicillin-binding protein 4)
MNRPGPGAQVDWRLAGRVGSSLARAGPPTTDTDLSGRVLTFAFISNNAGNEGRTAIDALAGQLRTCGCT